MSILKSKFSIEFELVKSDPEPLIHLNENSYELVIMQLNYFL